MINITIRSSETESRAVLSADTMVSEEYAAPILRTEVIERYKYYWNILPHYSGSKAYPGIRKF
jgi:hypothetical protein